jgi:hypothetical protein
MMDGCVGSTPARTYLVEAGRITLKQVSLLSSSLKVAMLSHRDIQRGIAVLAQAISLTLRGTQTMTKNNSKRRKLTSEKVDYPYRIGDYPNEGILPMMQRMTKHLPEDMKPEGERIGAYLNIGMQAAIGIFLIGTVVATVTGHSDQIMNIFAVDITGIGILTVGAIVRSFRKIL